MISRFLRNLAVAVVASHVIVATGLHFYGKKKQFSFTSPFKKRSEEERLLSWLTQVDRVPLIKDIAVNVKQLDSLRVRDDDIFIISYPKSGTTWLSEIVYNIIHDLNFVKARSLPLDERVPYLEWVYTYQSQIESMPCERPRILKSHLPLSLLPRQLSSSNRQCKIIYIMRNPRDVCVSYYYFTKMIQPVGYNGAFPDFFALYCQGRVAYGHWGSHVKSFWDARSQPHILFLTYEELLKEPIKTIDKIALFLDKPLSRDQLKILAHHCSFKKMRENPAANYDWLEKSDFKTKGLPFLRKGLIGDWKNHMTPEMILTIDSEVEQCADEKLLELIDYEPPPIVNETMDSLSR